MSSVIEPLIISQSGAIFIYRIALVCLLLCILYWHTKAAEAYGKVAILTHDDSERESYSLKGLFAGNHDAAKVYAALYPKRFMRHQPFDIRRREGIPCVFTHYYFPNRYEKYLSPSQTEINEDLLALKDGKNNMVVKYLKHGLSSFCPSPGTVILFMPCSKAWKYYKRYKPLSDYLDTDHRELVNGYNAIRITSDRESLHTQKGRSNITLEKNYVINMDLFGKEIIIFDDIITSGKSLREFSEELKQLGGVVVGAIFAATTFKMPTYLKIWWVAMKNPNREEQCSTGQKWQRGSQKPSQFRKLYD